MGGIVVANFTNMFKRVILLYSLGDLRLNAPISLKKVGYIIFFIVIYTAPIIYFNGIVLKPWFLLLVFVPPVLLGNYAAEPIWAGRNLLDFTTVYIKFATSPKYWCDLKACDDLMVNQKDKSGTSEPIHYEIWVSRRREIAELKALYAEENL